MSQVAKDLLASSYGVRGSKVRIIPHGIPVMDSHRDQRGAEGRVRRRRSALLLTFGLLSPNKGIETVIRALPAVVAAFPGSRLLRGRAPLIPAVVRQRGRGVSDAARARGREARRARARRVSRPVRLRRRVAPVSASGRRVRQPVPQRGAGHERRAVLRDGRGRGRGVDSVLARAGAARGRARLLVSVQGSRRVEPHVARAVRVARGARSACAPRRLRVHAARWRGRGSATRYFEVFAPPCAAAAAAACTPGARPAAPSSSARAASRSPATHDRRHRHHSARHLQRAGAAHRLLRRRQRARADRGRACRSRAGAPDDARARHHVPQLPARARRQPTAASATS